MPKTHNQFSYSAIAEWERNYGAHIARALGFRHTPPCAATLETIKKLGVTHPYGVE